MTIPKGIWLCPLCEAAEGTCKLCDGYSFVTDLEMEMFERNKEQEKSSMNPQNNIPGVFTLDPIETE